MKFKSIHITHILKHFIIFFNLFFVKSMNLISFDLTVTCTILFFRNYVNWHILILNNDLVNEMKLDFLVYWFENCNSWYMYLYSKYNCWQISLLLEQISRIRTLNLLENMSFEIQYFRAIYSICEPYSVATDNSSLIWRFNKVSYAAN